MVFKSTHTALTWSDSRAAALYFDRVMPVNIPDTYRADAEDPIYYEVLKSLLPEALLDPHSKTGLAGAVTSYVAYFLVAFPQAAGVASLPSGETLEQRAASTMPKLLDAFGHLVSSSGVRDFAVYGEPLSPATPGANSDPALVLSNLNLVDASKLSWRHILELRKDQDSIERLRNLRRAVYKDYSGKPEAYIKEDIEFRISEYEAATKFWNLPTQKGILEIAMTGEALAAVGGAVALALFGAPVVAAAAAGGAIAVGKAALSIAARKREIELERRRNPMAYLVKLRQATEVAA
ncbi:MAG TPA: hypothetical protein VHM00_01325 [Caldimonas sp.]|jgi:hypothetical protein|nr:hypothetical protein [Caldimonas sp.]